MLMRATTAFSRFVGPAALTAAGMIGAGAVATRLLAGAWFGFDLLWVALLVIPMVIFTLDSASRIGLTSGGRGLMEMIRSDIGAWLAWLVFLPMALVNVVVNMSQMSAMVEGAYGAMGMLPPAGGEGTVGLFLVTIVLTGSTVTAAVLGGYKRMEKIMTALLVVILACFIFVAIKGLLDWQTWPALAAGLVPTIPESVPVFGAPERARNAFTQIMAIAGQALPPAVLLSYGYLAANSGYTVADAKRTFWKTVTNLGVVWGMFSVVVIVAGATALHNVYTGSGPTHLGVSHYSQIETIPVAGQVLGPAFPGVLGFLAP
jgi:manganese transport protein